MEHVSSLSRAATAWSLTRVPSSQRRVSPSVIDATLQEKLPALVLSLDTDEVGQTNTARPTLMTKTVDSSMTTGSFPRPRFLFSMDDR